MKDGLIFKSQAMTDIELGKYAKYMTLRDYFASKALQGLLAYSTHKGRYAPPDNELAIESYKLADAMLKAREL
jgi:hypothetical protein